MGRKVENNKLKISLKAEQMDIRTNRKDEVAILTVLHTKKLLRTVKVHGS